MSWILKNLEEFPSREVGKSHSRQGRNDPMSNRMTSFIHLFIFQQHLLNIYHILETVGLVMTRECIVEQDIIVYLRNSLKIFCGWNIENVDQRVLALADKGT